MLKRIREIHEETKTAYGSPRIYQELKGFGIPVSKGRVERLKWENDLRGGTSGDSRRRPIRSNRSRWRRTVWNRT